MTLVTNAAPKGRNVIAQGIALGSGTICIFLALKGRDALYCAPSGRREVFVRVTQGVALGYFILRFQRTD